DGLAIGDAGVLAAAAFDELVDDEGQVPCGEGRLGERVHPGILSVRKDPSLHSCGRPRKCIYCICMKEISFGVRELQAHLGQALRAVQRGDRVVITSHGRPVAVMGKAEPRLKGKTPVERKLLRMAAE